jgi:hypothetical protein
LFASLRRPWTYCSSTRRRSWTCCESSGESACWRPNPPAASRQCASSIGPHASCDRRAPLRLAREKAMSADRVSGWLKPDGPWGGGSHQQCWVFFALELHGVEGVTGARPGSSYAADMTYTPSRRSLSKCRGAVTTALSAVAWGSSLRA